MATRKVTVLQVNDTHGYLEPHPELLWDGSSARCETLGGYARLAGLLRAVRAEQDGAVLALDNGDTFHGTYPVVRTKGEALVPLLNALSLDAMTGHWDFAYGPEHLLRLVSKLSYPFLAIKDHGDDPRQILTQAWSLGLVAQDDGVCLSVGARPPRLQSPSFLPLIGPWTRPFLSW